MRVLLINAVCGTGSTGKICAEIARKYEAEGHEVKITYGRYAFVPEDCQKYAVKIGTDLGIKFHALYTRITDKHGLGSKIATRKFLKWAEQYAPDIVWLHNIHGYYINYEMLFSWIKKHPEMEVKWTLHDCWAFTGHCTHFSMVKCDKWKTQCEACVQKRIYPESRVFDNSKDNYKRKRAAFCGVNNMTLITPSRWLAELVEKSFLGEYPIKVVNNTIDTNVFKRTESDFREKHGLQDKKLILGVASTWNERKGIDDFMKLSEMLDDTYRIVLVGLNEKQLKQLPKNILGIRRTNGQKELAEIYTAADIHVVASREETFGMTILEAYYCGTPSIVYKDTACEEVAAQYGGIVVAQSCEDIYHALRAYFEKIDIENAI